MRIPRFIALSLVVLFCCIITIFFIETVLVLLTMKSDGIKYLTYSPFRQTVFEKIVDWKTLQKSTNCSFSPGQQYIDYRANSHGFLTHELPYDNPNHEYRIVMLGDSFLTKGPHKYHISTLLESLMRNSQPRLNHAQVINLGIPCVGTSVYLKTLEIEGMLYKPDFIIVSFFVGNDFTDEDYTRAHLNALHTQPIHPIVRYVYSLRGIALIHNLFRFYTFSNNVQNIPSKAATTSYSDQWIPMNYSSYNPFAETMSEEGYIPIERSRLSVYYSNSNGYRNMNLLAENISSIKAIADITNTPILFLVIPDELQVSQALRNKVLESTEQNEDFNLHLPQQTIASLLDKMNIPYIDVLSYFEHDAQPEKYYQPNDSHLNSYGNSRVAEIIFNTLSTTGIFHVDSK